MAKTTTAGDRRQLRGDLDRLVRRARKVLDKAYLGARSRQVLCRTLALSFLFALPMLTVCFGAHSRSNLAAKPTRCRSVRRSDRWSAYPALGVPFFVTTVSY